MDFCIGIVNLALEYCPLGSLDKFLQGNGKLNTEILLDEECQNLNYVTTACLNGYFSYINGGQFVICLDYYSHGF